MSGLRQCEEWDLDMQIYWACKYKLANGQFLGAVSEHRSDVLPEKTMGS